MANHEILLLKPVDGLGAEGDQVKVRAGYARNFLLPQGKAVPLTQANRKHVEALKKARGLREAKELDGAQALAKQIEKAGIAIAVKTGEGGKLFGSVTGKDVSDALKKQHIDIDKRKITIQGEVTGTGVYEAVIKVHPTVTSKIKVSVVAE